MTEKLEVVVSVRCAIHDTAMGRFEFELDEDGMWTGFIRANRGSRASSRNAPPHRRYGFTGRHPSAGLGGATQGVVHIYCRRCPGHPRHEEIKIERFFELVDAEWRRMDFVTPRVLLLM